MNLNDVLFIESFPKLDLHGYDRDTAGMLINDFIRDNVKLKNEIVVIVHGIGLGILRKKTIEVLGNNSNVLEYKGIIGNSGCVIVKLKI